MSIKKTLIRFTFWYLLLLIIVIIVFSLFSVKKTSMINEVVLLGVATLACQCFTRSNKRSFTPAEKKFLLWGMLAIDQTIQVLGFVLLVPSFHSVHFLKLFLMVIIFVFLALIHLFIIYIGIDFSERKARVYVSQE